MAKYTKKIILLSLSILVLGMGLAWWAITRELATPTSCAFCNPEVIQTHTFYEDSLVRCLCSHKPVQPGHCLVIVKRHIERFDQTSDEEMAAIGHMIKKINTAIQKINGPSDYLILQKNGPEVGQTVPHVHFHYIPKKITGSKIAVFGLLWNFVITQFKKALGKQELAAEVEKMKEAISA